MRRQLLIVLALLVSALLMVGCGTTAPPAGTEFRVWLTTTTQRAVVKDQEFRINVEASASGQPVTSLKISGELLDAAGTSQAKLDCAPMTDKPGRYQSSPFRPKKEAVPGVWVVKAMTGQESKNPVAAENKVQVGDSLGGTISARLGISLPVPASWDILDQQSTDNSSLLRLNPLPVNALDEATLDIRYVRGNVEVTEAALKQFLLTTYRPGSYKKGNAYWRLTAPVMVEGHQGIMVRGGFVTDVDPVKPPTLEPGKPTLDPSKPTAAPVKLDRNFSIVVMRFYCNISDRTFTVIQSSTSEEAQSQMAAVFDQFECH
jgi:hypothetical protein